MSVKVGDVIEKGSEEIPAEVVGVDDSYGDGWRRRSAGWHEYPEVQRGARCDSDRLLSDAPLTVTKIREAAPRRSHGGPSLPHTDSRAAFEGIQSATVLKPGDRVLIDCGMSARRSDVDALHSYLKERMPDVVFAVIGGARVVSAAPTEDVVVEPVEETE